MAETTQLNYAWLAELTNPHHDGMTQQIDDFAAAFTTDNARYLAMAEALNPVATAAVTILEAAAGLFRIDTNLLNIEKHGRRKTGSSVFFSCFFDVEA